MSLTCPSCPHSLECKPLTQDLTKEQVSSQTRPQPTDQRTSEHGLQDLSMHRMSPCSWPSVPSKKFLKLIADLPHHQASFIFQLCTGHVPLNNHLHQIKKAPSPMCPHCLEKCETIVHYLLFCPAYTRCWMKLNNKLKQKARDLSTLLADPYGIKPLLIYAHAAGWLEGSFGNLNPPSNKHWSHTRTDTVPYHLS